MEIIYKGKNPGKNEYYKLFLTTGWNEKYKFTDEDLIAANKKSWYKVSAYHKKILIGYGRIIFDGIYHALIADMIVHPDYQNHGIGKNILNKLIQKCRKNNIRDIQLFCAKGKAGFYSSSGFEERPFDEPGMQLKVESSEKK